MVVAFADDATVADANQAIANSGALIGGALPSLGLLLLIVPPTDDFSALDVALETLRANPAVAIAAMDVMSEPAVVDTAPEFGPWELPPNNQFVEDGAWHLIASRFPQAWNLLEAFSLPGSVPSPFTIVADWGFNLGHEDLDFLFPAPPPTVGPSVLPDLCVAGACIRLIAEEHGTHVSGVIAATHDNGRGVSGANPLARVIAVNLHTPVAAPWLFANPFLPRSENLWNAIFDFVETVQKDGFGRVHAINYSQGIPVPDPANWVAAWNNAIQGHSILACGPNTNDDGQPGSNLPCTYATEDQSLMERTQWGEVGRVVAQRAARIGITIVAAAGNESDDFCVVEASGAPTLAAVPKNSAPPVPGCTSATFVRSDAKYTSEFTYAAATWNAADGPNPILVVEALDADLSLTDFSNIAAFPGALSAPGLGVLSTCGVPNGYCRESGTSQSTPLVTALLGILATWSPNSTYDQLQNRVLDWAKADTLGDPTTTADDAQPRIDAFASLMSFEGAAGILVDLNDASRDGNRRVVLGPGNTEQGVDSVFSPVPDAFTAPDGTVDVRDFRRFRDAWLQACLDPLARAGATCPAAADVALNGADTDAKRDLNLDGCVRINDTQTPNCLTEDTAFPRTDFNGDGRVSTDPASGVVVPLRETSPGVWQAAAAPPGTVMTDLQVLQSQWDEPGPSEEGWRRADLDTLLLSGDLEVHGAGLFDSGASGVFVDILTSSDDLILRRTLTRDSNLPANEDFAVIPVPRGDNLTVRFRAAFPGGDDVIFERIVPQLRAGEDLRVDSCDFVALTADRLSIRPDGNATANVVANVTPCSGPPADLPVTFTSSPFGAGHATIASTQVVTDADGRIDATFTAGTERTNYVITATATVPTADGESRPITGQLHLEVDSRYGYEVIAAAGASQALDTLGPGPSIRDDGAVAFVGTHNGVGDVYVADTLGDIVNVSAGGLATIDGFATFSGQVWLGTDGSVFGHASASVEQHVRTWAPRRRGPCSSTSPIPAATTGPRGLPHDRPGPSRYRRATSTPRRRGLASGPVRRPAGRGPFPADARRRRSDRRPRGLPSRRR